MLSDEIEERTHLLELGNAVSYNSVSQSENNDVGFICNICLDRVSDPVVTQCGHLYCWSCIYKWVQGDHHTCPVCSAGVSNDNLIPIYINGHDRNSSNAIPGRPIGRRPVAESPTGFRDNANYRNQPVLNNYGHFPALFALQIQYFANTTATNAANYIATNNTNNMHPNSDSIRYIIWSYFTFLVNYIFVYKPAPPTTALEAEQIRINHTIRYAILVLIVFWIVI